jgi:hypothetical protein
MIAGPKAEGEQAPGEALGLGKPAGEGEAPTAQGKDQRLFVRAKPRLVAQGRAGGLEGREVAQIH